MFQNEIFNKYKYISHLERNRENFNNDDFLEYVSKDIFDRLNNLSKNFNVIWTIGYKGDYLINNLKQKYPEAELIISEASSLLLKNLNITNNKIVINPEKNNFQNASIDLIIFTFGLHWINNIEKFLNNIISCLSFEGIFIANFIGAGSLKNLRSKFINIESALNLPYSPHISPFIQFDQIGALLQHSGFKEMIIDYENIELEYQNAFSLMKAIKKIGETNCLNKMAPYAITKKVYKLLQQETKIFYDQIKLISFIASKNKNCIKIITS